MTTDFIANAKKRDIPAPGAYEVDKVINKPILGFTTVSEKATYHVDEAVHYAKQTPTICYKDIGSLTTMRKQRCKYTKIFEVKERPSFDPLIVHIGRKSDLEKVAVVPEEIRELVDELI
mgnify:CR=1 FL=1